MYGKLFRNVLYPAYESGLRGRKTLEYLEEYKKQQWLSAADIRTLQLGKLTKLLEFCQAEVPYYQKQWKSLGFDWRDVKSVADYTQLPTLRKDDVRTNYEDLIATSYRGKTMSKATGGSTGQPFRFEYTRESYERRIAVMLRGYGWAGADFGVKRLDIWGSDLGLGSQTQRFKANLFDKVLRRKVLNSFAMTRDNLSDYAAEIERFGPEVIVGYTSPLYELAKWILENKPLKWKPGAIVTAAEMLDAVQRDVIERAFGAPVFHTYGCREFMLIGAECEKHEGYHLSADHMVVEVCNDQGHTLSSGTGNIVITDLSNFGMPLLRYVNGDIGTAIDHGKACSCGRGLPLLAAVEGRKLDILRTADGRIIPGEFFPHLLKEIPAIHHFQVRQTALDHLKILIVKGAAFSDKDVSFLRSKIEPIVGPSTSLEFVYVESIELTPSGKRRVTVSEIEPVVL